jgi:hypothetical protein
MPDSGAHAGRQPNESHAMPPTTPAIKIGADTREHAEVPFSSTPALVQQGRGRRKRNARAFLTRRRARRLVRTSSYYDPLFGRPDLVENDYYRFRNHAGG